MSDEKYFKKRAAYYRDMGMQNIGSAASAYIWADDKMTELDAENHRLRETLHQIYGEACQLLNSEDDVDVWAFVKLARDKALEG